MTGARGALVVCDVGGTAIRDTVDVAAVFTRALERFGVTPRREAVMAARGASKRDAIAALVAHADPAPDSEEVYQAFQDLLIEAFETRGVEVIPGVPGAFEHLYARSIPVVLTTGFDRRVMAAVMDRLAGQIVVSGVVTSDDVSRGRPAPDLIYAAMRLVDVADPLSVVAVGDTVNDLEAADAAGVGASIGVLTGAHDRAKLSTVPNTAILDSVAQLPRWLEEHDWLGVPPE